jgi:comEA protein
MDRYEAEKKKGSNHRRWYGLFLLCCLLLAGLSLWDRYQENRMAVQIDVGETSGKPTDKADQAGQVTQGVQTAPVASATAINLIPVYLVGAVACPGIYQVERGTYLYELVDLAGGLTGQAASDAVNLAACIETNQMIRIPTQAEIDAGYVFALQDSETAAGALVDLNRADQKQLETLPGIGPATARAIIAYREANGFFDRIEDLMQVPGIKEARFNTLKDLVMVSAP